MTPPISHLKSLKRLASLGIIWVLLSACTSSPGSLATPTSPAPPTVPAATETPAPTATQTSAAPTPTETPSEGSGVEEAILILEPGPGSRVVSPLHFSGLADSTFEQTLGVRLVSDDGTEILRSSVMIASELGQRGPFEADLEFTIDGERQAFLQVFASSPRDGGITHLSSVGIILASQGPAEIRQNQPHDERLRIDMPVQGEETQGGTLHVEGFALASFEQALFIELLAENGDVLASQAVIVAAPEMGIPGPFEADLSYPPGTSGAGRVVVRDPSPAFNGDIHLASVEIRFIP